MKWFLYFVIIFLALLFLAGKVSLASYTVVDTLYPVGNGDVNNWTGATPHWEQFNEPGCVRTDSVYATAANLKETFTVLPRAFLPWVDSMKLAICGNSNGFATTTVQIGKAKDVEGTFAWCGAYRTVTLPASSNPAVLTMAAHTGDSCSACAWTAYNILQNQWGISKPGSGSIPVSVLQSARALAYSTYPDTLPTGEQSVYFATASACFCSTWEVFNCNDADSCLSYFGNISDLRTNVAGNLHAWSLSNLDLPANTKIDSVQEWYDGFAVPTYDSVIQAGYVTKSAETCAMWDSNAIIFSNVSAAEHGWFQKVTHTTCPATGLPWVIGDLNDANKGFGLKCLYNSYFAMTWFRAIVFVSMSTSSPGQIIIIGKRDTGRTSQKAWLKNRKV